MLFANFRCSCMFAEFARPCRVKYVGEKSPTQLHNCRNSSSGDIWQHRSISNSFKTTMVQKNVQSSHPDHCSENHNNFKFATRSRLTNPAGNISVPVPACHLLVPRLPRPGQESKELHEANAKRVKTCADDSRLVNFTSDWMKKWRQFRYSGKNYC